MHILLGRGLRVDPRLSVEIMPLDWPGNVSVFPWINWIRWLGTQPRIGIKKWMEWFCIRVCVTICKRVSWSIVHPVM